jgi:Flp pilus assembly pilin Flp
MRRWQKIRRFIRSAHGPTAIEYAFLLGVIVLICTAGARSIGGEIKAGIIETFVAIGHCVNLILEHLTSAPIDLL